MAGYCGYVLVEQGTQSRERIFACSCLRKHASNEDLFRKETREETLPIHGDISLLLTMHSL